MLKDTALSLRGGGFLLDDAAPGDIFTPEMFSDEQRMIGRTAEDFVRRRVRPRLDDMEAGDHGVTVSLLQEAAELGLLGAEVPEAFGGLGLDGPSGTLITEKMAWGASFGISFSVHAGIGTTPLVLFGSEAQKARYLPAMARGDKVAAYALTEPDAGSDARAGRTSASVSRDSGGYVLNGQKQWITNSGFADLFVVFAKVDGQKMTAFLVDSESEGLRIGPEVEKMGLHGTSTCEVYFEDVPVPEENLLGEVGRGHVIAFNTLNFGRLKLGAGNLGAAKAVLETCAGYTGERRQFGRPIAEFPAVQQKLARMASRIFALESVIYRTSALFDQALAPLRDGGGEDLDAVAEATGEYAVEASISKVLGSEALGFVVDEGVQLHGGYGYIRGFDVERAYRDARISRIFEGTNEINRLLITGTVIRRGDQGRLPVAKSIETAEASALSYAGDGPPASQASHLSNLKRATLIVAGLGIGKYRDRVMDEQEFLMAVADLAICAYSWESALLRTQWLVERVGVEAAAAALDLATLFGDWAMGRAESTALSALAGLEEGEALQDQLAAMRRLFQRTPVNSVALGRRVARRVLSLGGYSALAKTPA